MNLLLIFIGGGLGAVARHSLSSFVMRQTGSGFPYGTLAVNLIGAFLIGLIIEFSAVKLSIPKEMKLLLVTGILGGFTTFSAFSLDMIVLMQRGAILSCVLYIAASVIGGLLAVYAGMSLIRAI